MSGRRESMNVRLHCIACRYLYGIKPTIDHSLVHKLLLCASFFDIPSLCAAVSDYVFLSLQPATVVDYLQLMQGREFGEPGEDPLHRSAGRQAPAMAQAVWHRAPLSTHCHCHLQAS